MGKHRVILEPQIVDPKSLGGSDWSSVEVALQQFEKATSEFNLPTVKRMTIKSLADMAVFGNLLLKARKLYKASVQESPENGGFLTCETGQNSRTQPRENSGLFSSTDGFIAWLKEKFPGLHISSFYRYMNLAENVGMGERMNPQYVLSPAVKATLRRPLKQLYLNPDDFRDQLRLERIASGKEPEDQAFREHLYFKKLLAGMQDSFREVRRLLSRMDENDLAVVEQFFDRSMKTIQDTRKGR